MIADIEYLKLSLRKDRKVLVGLTAAFAGTLTLSLAMAAADQQVIMAFWIFFGLPVVGALLGGSSGAEARADADVESALPLSPGRRTLGRLAMGILGVAVLTAVLWGAERVLPRAARLPFSVDAGFARMSLYAMYGSFAAFAIGYACESTAIGAVGGMLVMVLLGGVIGPMVLMERLFPGRGPFSAALWAILASGLAAAAVSVALTARKHVYRRVSDAEHAVLQIVVGAALVSAILLLSGRYATAFWTGLELYPGFIGSLTLAPRGSKLPLEVRQRAPEGGTYAGALDGRLDWLTQDGRRVQLAPPRRDRGVLKAVQDLPNAGAGELFYSSDGMVWLLRPAGTAGGSEVWRGRPGEPMALFATLPDGTWADALVETHAGMSVLNTYPKHRLAALAPGRSLDWKEISWRGAWSWRMMGSAVLPDGSSASVWQDGRGLRRDEGTIKVREPNGTLVPRGTVRIDPDYNWPLLVRLDERNAWYVEGYWLTRRDLRGRLQGSWPLPQWPWQRGGWQRVTTPLRPSSEGLYVRTPGHVTLVGWDGRVQGRFPL